MSSTPERSVAHDAPIAAAAAEARDARAIFNECIDRFERQHGDEEGTLAKLRSVVTALERGAAARSSGGGGGAGGAGGGGHGSAAGARSGAARERPTPFPPQPLPRALPMYGTMHFCQACRRMVPQSGFSKQQMKKPIRNRRCTQCVNDGRLKPTA